MPKQLFRYAFCGAFAVGVDIVTFALAYNFVFKKQLVHLGFITLRPETASLALAFSVSAITGFLLQKYITFVNSNLRGRVQLFRYLLIVAACLAMNYYGILYLVTQWQVFPTMAKIIVTPFIVTFSYFSQRYFSFRQKKEAVY